MKCGEFMPLIDNYLIDNYLIDGPPGGGKYQAKVLNSSPGQIVFVPAQTTYMNVTNLLDFEAGTKLITVGVAVSSGPWQMTTYNSTTVLMRFALFDSAGVPWFLHDIGALQTNYSVGSITIDLIVGVAMALQTGSDSGFGSGINTSSTWKGIYFNKPANFNVNGPLKLGVCGANATQNNGNGQYTITNMRVTSF